MILNDINDRKPLFMIDNGKEVIGVENVGDSVSYEAIRVSENGDLLLEMSITKTKPEQVLLPIADAGEGTAVYGYRVCVPKP